LKSMAVVFFLEWILEHCGFVIVFIDECGWWNATQERESTHDNNDRIKEEANANAFFEFTHY
jgi:hypothetical protein